MEDNDRLATMVRNGTSFLQFNRLAEFDDIEHAVFTRHGGCSQPPFDSLNITYGLGDEDLSVRCNRQRVAQALGGQKLVFAHQVHGTGVVQIQAQDTDPTTGIEGIAPVGDALVTDQAGQLLVIQVADCQSVLLYEPVRQVVANVHSGWRGSVRNIIGRTIGVMAERFKCDPGRIHAAIGPSLGPCCAEFIHYRQEIPESLWGYRNAGVHFDFWSLSCDQLLQAGVLKQNIEVSRLCTRCRTDLFFSYRGEGITGRFAVVIGLRSL